MGIFDIFKSKIEDGEHVTYYPGTEIVGDIVNVMNGVPHGKCTYYYSSGEILCEMVYKNGFIKDGTIINLFYKNGTISDEINVKNNKLNGDHIIYDCFGNKFSSLRFEDGGSVWTDDYLEELEEGESISQENDDTEDLIIFYDYNPNVRSDVFESMIYPLCEYNKIIYETIDSFKQHLMGTKLFDLGVLVSNRRTLNEGMGTQIPDGELIGYVGNNKIVENFQDGVEEGDFFIYHENGNIKTEGNYYKGNKTGKWTTYHTDGSVWYIELYDNEGNKLGPTKIINKE